MNNVVTELLASQIPAVARPFVLALCMGEGGIDAKAWLRCYGGQVLDVPLTSVFNSQNKLWGGKDNSHALGAGQFQPATYEEAAARTGLTTLEPQSQLANLYNHLQHVYTRAGGNLEADLAAGKYADVAAALPSTWTSLGLTNNVKSHYLLAEKMLASAPVVPAPAPVEPAPLVLSDGNDPTTALDPEVQAMADMLDILQGLAMDGRQRVLSYVTARFNIDLKG